MKKLFFTLTLLVWHPLISQNYIYGKWQLVQIQTKEVTFDLNNPDQTYQEYCNYQKKFFDRALTKEDSSAIYERYYAFISDFKKLNMEFNVDSSFSINKFKGGGKITEEREYGKFYIENKKTIIAHAGKIRILKLKKDLLVIRFMDIPKNFRYKYTFNK